MSVATDYYNDPFLYDKCVWVAELSNGVKVYQDDNRPGEATPNAITRLQTYLVDNGLFIRNLGLKFRSNEIFPLPQNQEYYFADGMIAGPGLPVIQTKTIGYTLDVDAYIVYVYRVPEMFLLEDEIRRIEVPGGFL